MIRLALKVANRLYGHSLVRDFGPIALKACRAEFVRQGLSRHACNRRTNLIKQAFPHPELIGIPRRSLTPEQKAGHLDRW
jgi:hypothetical protein